MELIAETRHGRVRGTDSDDVRVWLGIPYARPPVGPLRFGSPEPPAPWDGIRDATRFAPTAMQRDVFRLDQQLNIPQPRSSEDCLYLNVWAPPTPDEPQPVLVWIHGGGFVEGAGSDDHYDGSRFARHGNVVVVTLNYRLGAFGFLHLADLLDEQRTSEFASNLALLDQIAALRWVRENIAAFGGDPDQITIFGESAGGISVATLLAMPTARGLFRRAIVQSGGMQVHTRAQATAVARALLAELGLDDDVGRIRALAAEEIQRATERYLGREGRPLFLPFRPVVDGRSLPIATPEAIADGSATGIPLIVGFNRDEGNLFYPEDPAPASQPEEATTALFSPSAKRPVAPDHLRALLEDVLGPEHAAAAIGQYELSVRGMARAVTDAFRWRAIALVEAQLAHAPVWMYRFDWSSSSQQLFKGAVHALEVPFVWNTLDTPFGQAMTGGALDAQPLADLIHDAWIAFARTGDPNTPALPAWPRHTAERPAAMLLDRRPVVRVLSRSADG